MEDSKIVELYWQKNADAIKETDSKYGAYCFAIADNILRNKEDSEECVNDTWLNAWNAMPPQKPTKLQMFLAKITRNLSFNRFNARSAEKRGGGEIVLVLDELAECIPDGPDGEALTESQMWRANTRPESLASASGCLSVRCRSGTAMYSCAATSSPSLWRRSPSDMA